MLQRLITEILPFDFDAEHEIHTVINGPKLLWDAVFVLEEHV